MPEVAIASGNKIADVGTAVHEAIAAHIVGNGNSPEDICAKFGVDHEDCGWMIRRGIAYYQSLIDAGYKMVSCEGEYRKAAGAIELTGHPDLVMMSPDGVPVIIDWKTGHRDASYRDQLCGYAYLMSDTYPTEVVKLVSVYLRLDVVDNTEITGAEVESFVDRLCGLVSEWEHKAFNPTSDNCIYCPLSGTCEGRREVITQAARSMMATMDQGGIKFEITPATIGVLYEQSKMLKKVIEVFDDQLRQYIDIQGVVDLGGAKMYLEDCERTSCVKFDGDILREYLGDDLGKLDLEISLKQAQDIAGDRAGRGQKGKVKAELKERMEKAGLIVKTQFKKLTVKKD
jgi:hypothetical protein